jgi:hypothetical protein
MKYWMTFGPKGEKARFFIFLGERSEAFSVTSDFWFRVIFLCPVGNRLSQRARRVATIDAQLVLVTAESEEK